jgi:hypothetical protein
MTTNLRMPTEQDWGEFDADLDQQYAHQIFSGKCIEEAIPLFERNVIERCSELQFMPLIPFQYYMFALRDYVMSDRVLISEMSSDAASCFLGLVLLKLNEEPASIFPIMEDMIPAVQYVASNQEIFDADIDIYGNFAEKLIDIKKKYEEIKRGLTK